MISKDNNDNSINFSIDTLDAMLKAKCKTKRVIESCKTNTQLDGAKRLVEHYFQATEDMVGTSELQLDVLSKRKVVKDNSFTKREWNKLIKILQKNN